MFQSQKCSMYSQQRIKNLVDMQIILLNFILNYFEKSSSKILFSSPRGRRVGLKLYSYRELYSHGWHDKLNLPPWPGNSVLHILNMYQVPVCLSCFITC